MTPLRGIVIEGVDYIGKTTVMDALAALLNGRSGVGFPLRGKCYASGHPSVAFLDREAKRHGQMRVQDQYYTAAILLDLALLGGDDGRFRLQERHWLTQVSRNSFFHPGQDFISTDRIAQRRSIFELGVLLTSDVPSKRARAAARPAKCPRDRLLASDADLHQAFEDHLVSLVPAEEKWMLIDTSRLAPAAIAAAILDEYAGRAPPADPRARAGAAGLVMRTDRRPALPARA